MNLNKDDPQHDGSLNQLKTTLYRGNHTANTRQENDGLNGMWIVVDQSELLQLPRVAEYFDYLNFTPDTVALLPQSKIHHGNI